MSENPRPYAVGKMGCRQPTSDAMAFVLELLAGIENSFAIAIEAEDGWSEAGSLAAIGDSIDMIDQLLKTYDGQRTAFSDHLAEWSADRGLAALQKAVESRRDLARTPPPEWQEAKRALATGYGLRGTWGRR